MMKKVLIIVYYWPPAGGGGVQRWVKFVKYLRDFGWEPIVYAPENPDYPLLDPSLAKEVPPDVEVVRHPIWEPYRIYQYLMGKKGQQTHAGFISQGGKPSLKSRIIHFIRGNFFIPDARTFWVKPSVRFLSQYLKEHPVDALITTGPPHSMHLIGLGLRRKTGIPWLADFRDPWVNMDNLDEFQFTRWVFNQHQRLERQVLSEADRVATVAPFMATEYEKIRHKQVDVLTNGFDEEDIVVDKELAHPRFVIGHYGTFGKDRNPHVLWKALQGLVEELPSMKTVLTIEVVGPTDGAVFADIEAHGLKEWVSYTDYLPHAEAIERMKAASVLLLLLNQNTNMESRLTGKIYEYMAVQKPILGLGTTTSDPSKVLTQTGTGEMIDYQDEAGIKRYLLQAFQRFRRGEHWVKPEGIQVYTRRAITRQLAGVLDAMCKEKDSAQEAV